MEGPDVAKKKPSRDGARGEPRQAVNRFIFFEIHNRILFKIKALRLTHNTHTTTLKRSKPARKHTHPPPHHTYQRTPHTK